MVGLMTPRHSLQPAQSPSSGCASGPTSSTPAVSNAVMNIAAGESSESCVDGYLHDIGSGSSLTVGDRGIGTDGRTSGPGFP